MPTGSGPVLTTQSIPLSLQYFLDNTNTFLFEFGFASQESSSPGGFLDSFTVSLNSANGDIYLLTADSSGVQWAPMTFGAVSISSDDLERQTAPYAVAYDSMTPILSYQVSFALPSSWAGLPVTATLDLHDNQNSLMSQGYFTLVPEPAAMFLFLSGAAVLLALRPKR